MEKLNGDERIKEITVMLSGLQHTEIATENAKELIEKAAAWKKDRSIKRLNIKS